MNSYMNPSFLLLFLPLVIIIYAVTKQKYRWIVLLLASLTFFCILSAHLVIYILITTLIIHYIGIWLTHIKNTCNNELIEIPKEERKIIKSKYQKKERFAVALGVLLILSILIVMKYTNFFLQNVNSLLKVLQNDFRFKWVNIVLPIGISFYSLQAISYMFDVYRGKIEADQNIFRLLLYLSFFPQIMEGPIARYSETAEKLYEGKQIEYNNLCRGVQRIAFGVMKKVLVADRVNMYVQEIFMNYYNYDGGMIFLAVILYTIQLYMDFSGMIDVAIGIGEIFGIKLPENFKQPFASKTISEFWTRWHITLGSWFREYVFYPISLSKPIKNLTSKTRKRFGNYYGPVLTGGIALFVVWLFNGIWHGAAWTFIFFGLYHFFFILMGNLFEPLVRNICTKLHINRQAKWYVCMQIIKTTIIVIFGELFFRAVSMKAGINMFVRIVRHFSFDNFSAIPSMGLALYDFIVIGVVLAIVFIIGCLKEHNINIRELISRRNVVVRWSIYLILIFSIILFGAYGIGYVPIDPMYANF